MQTISLNSASSSISYTAFYNSGPAKHWKVLYNYFHRHCLLIAGIHARWVTHGMRKMTRVDATSDFEFKGHFEGHKVNWGQNVESLSRNVVFLYVKVVCIPIIAKLSCFHNQTRIVCMSVYITCCHGSQSMTTQSMPDGYLCILRIWNCLKWQHHRSTQSSCKGTSLWREPKDDSTNFPLTRQLSGQTSHARCRTAS